MHVVLLLLCLLFERVPGGAQWGHNAASVTVAPAGQCVEDPCSHLLKSPGHSARREYAEDGGEPLAGNRSICFSVTGVPEHLVA